LLGGCCHSCLLHLACLFTVHVKECPSPTLQWRIPPFSHCYKSSPLQAHWRRWCFSGWLVYLQFKWGVPLSHSLVLRVPRPLCYVSFFFQLLVIIQFGFFLFFYPGGGQSVQGAMLIWPRVVSGSTVCCLAHLVVCISGAGSSWHLALWEHSWFLCLMWSGDAMRGLGVWRSQSFASSLWCFIQSVSPASLQDFTLGSTISASSL
jgi:hypothetical protein